MDITNPEDQETIREFLVESEENLTRLDQDLVELEKHPDDRNLLGSIFRTIHTIKGACGFLAFSTLEGITHQAESLLSQLRDGKRSLTPALVSLILETVDATRKVLASIEKTGTDGPALFADLTERLRASAELKTTEPVAKAAPSPVISGSVEGSVVELPAPSSAQVSVEEKRTELGEKREERKDEDSDRHSVAAADSNIRVGVSLLDKLMDLVGELVLTRNQILQFNTDREDVTLNATSQRLNLITTELQEGVMKTRMQPIGMVWNKLPRVVRDMSISLGKQIHLEMDGADTELDRTIIEAIKDPLMHLVRNSCDHGIELPEARIKAGKPAEGSLTLRAYHEGGQVNIEISDDGAGIDVQRVKQKAIENGLTRPEVADKLSDRDVLGFIFLPGFSMAKEVTNISGRGVGMDVVKSHIEKIGGVVDVFSRAGQGTTFKIRIPLTLAIIPGLIISSAGERFVIPQVSLLELIRLEGDLAGKHIEYVHGTPVYRRRGSLLPITYLNQVLGLRASNESEAVSMVVLQAEDRQFGLVVDGINDTQEIVVKPLGKQLKGLTLYAGATIMGDGRVALILDVLGIGERSGVFGESHEQARVVENKQKAQSDVEQQRLLLFRAGSFDRLAVPLSLVARLEEFPQSSIEHAGGGPVVQYRNRILPLVSLQAILEPGSPIKALQSDPVQVVVFNDGDRNVGMVVDQIVDVVEDAVTARQKSHHKGLLGSTVVGKCVTDFLDLNAVIHAPEGNWNESAERRGAGKTILLAVASSFSRGMIRAALDMAGYTVDEAANLDDGLRILESQPVSAIVADLNLPPDGCTALLTAIRRRPEWEGIPILKVADPTSSSTASAAISADLHEFHSTNDSEAILGSLSQLVSTAGALVPECVGGKR
jgi:two-component system chemotaxis sensor kinase CheA